MKRAGGLWPRITTFDNLYEAARRARRGKRFRDDVLTFHHEVERRLFTLREDLESRRYAPGPYRTFVIYEPKRRLISAAPYRDRVVHHALCNVIGPIFDKRLLDSCYANREGRGTRAALDHFRWCVQRRRYRYCLRADVVKYFPSIDHQILKETVRRTIKCANTLWLMDGIIDNANPQEPVEHYFEGDGLLTPCERRIGLPIGNLTSQLWANVYLSSLDHAVAGRYGGKRYLRYVDDIALFSDDRAELEEARGFIEERLRESRLKLHPVKSQTTEVRHGVNFLGFRFFPDRVRLRSENLRRARRRLRSLKEAYQEGLLTVEEVGNSVRSWIAHAAYGDTYRVRENVFDRLAFVRG